MNVRKHASIAALAATLAFAGQAQATPTYDTGTVQVSASITPVCYIGDGTLAFGNITSIAQGSAGHKADAGDTNSTTSSIAYVCSNGADASFTISSPNADSGQLQMTKGSDRLAYNVYTDSSVETPVIPGTTQVALTADGSDKNITLYGVVPGAGANVPVGDYTDTLTLTVAY